MKSRKFRRAVEKVLAHEGGYVNNPSDPGGETKYGISKRSYPHLDIKGLTREDAIAIYYEDWWEPGRFEEIESIEVAVKVFDLAVNMGQSRAVQLLQRALEEVGEKCVEESGVMDSETVEAANNADPESLLEALCEEAADYYRALVRENGSLEVFLEGWLNRAYS